MRVDQVPIFKTYSPLSMTGIKYLFVISSSRTNVVGIFPNERAIIRLVGAMMLEQNDEWSLQQRYVQFEGLQSLNESQPARLSAVIN
jgi:putative transposase